MHKLLILFWALFWSNQTRHGETLDDVLAQCSLTSQAHVSHVGSDNGNLSFRVLLELIARIAPLVSSSQTL